MRKGETFNGIRNVVKQLSFPLTMKNVKAVRQMRFFCYGFWGEETTAN